jgi:VWFA-related protein
VRVRLVLFAAIACVPIFVGAQALRLADARSGQAARPAPQEPTPTFRAGVRAIQVDAVVTDERGNPVRGLTADDFEIVEKGKPQAVTTFEAVDIPIERQLSDLADSDVVTNEGDGRIYLIVIDSISAVNGMYAKRILRRFLEDHFGAGDVAAVMLLDRGHTNAGQDFTSNRRLLIKGIDSFIGYGEGDVGKERAVAGSASPFVVGEGGDALLGAVNRMGRLMDLTEFLIKTPGRRKAMILISEAIGFDATDFKDYRGTSMKPAAQFAHAAMTAATRGNIAVYPIHPGGVGASDLAETMELRTIAEATGGFAVVNSNEFDASFTRLVEENSVYYMLGFNSGQEKDNGIYVPVTVRVKRPGLRVHAREGYLAPFKGKDHVLPVERRPGVESAVASPVPVGGVPLRAFAAAFKGKGKKASIAVSLETDPQALGLVEGPNGALRGSVDVRLVVTDVRANRVPQIRPQAGKIAVPARKPGDARREGLRILTKADLEPGRYQLRIAVGTAQRGGSVIYDLDVPDFSKKDLAMSGLVLRGPEKPEGVFLPAGDPLEALALRGPTTTRVFTKADVVSAYAEVYETNDDRPHNIAVLAVVRSEAGQETPVASAVLSSEEIKKAGNVLKVEPQLPLTKLAPGRYVFSLEAKSSAGGDSVVRTVPFQIK